MSPVSSITVAFAGAFDEVNGIDDPHEQREQFAFRLAALGAAYGVR